MKKIVLPVPEIKVIWDKISHQYSVTCEECYCLYRLAKHSLQYQKYPIIEIGSFKGVSTTVLARAVKDCAPNVKLNAVDIDFQPECKKNLEQFDLLKYVNMVQNDSLKIKHNFAGDKISLIFLDGDHKYETVKAEINKFHGLVIQNGVLCGHDYKHCPGVTQAVNEFVGSKIGKQFKFKKYKNFWYAVKK